MALTMAGLMLNTVISVPPSMILLLLTVAIVPNIVIATRHAFTTGMSRWYRDMRYKCKKITAMINIFDNTIAFQSLPKMPLLISGDSSEPSASYP